MQLRTLLSEEHLTQRLIEQSTKEQEMSPEVTTLTIDPVVDEPQDELNDDQIE